MRLWMHSLSTNLATTTTIQQNYASKQYNCFDSSICCVSIACHSTWFTKIRWAFFNFIIFINFFAILLSLFIARNVFYILTIKCCVCIHTVFRCLTATAKSFAAIDFLLLTQIVLHAKLKINSLWYFQSQFSENKIIVRRLSNVRNHFCFCFRFVLWLVTEILFKLERTKKIKM